MYLTIGDLQEILCKQKVTAPTYPIIGMLKDHHITIRTLNACSSVTHFFVFTFIDRADPSKTSLGVYSILKVETAPFLCVQISFKLHWDKLTITRIIALV